jgi:hypothetical protein
MAGLLLACAWRIEDAASSSIPIEEEEEEAARPGS